jgi:hypothetical protein
VRVTLPKSCEAEQSPTLPDMRLTPYLSGSVDVAFEFFQKLGVEYWAFHDIDLAPEGNNMAEVGDCNLIDHSARQPLTTVSDL